MGGGTPLGDPGCPDGPVPGSPCTGPEGNTGPPGQETGTLPGTGFSNEDRRGYSAFKNRHLWAVDVAINALRAAGHQFDDAEIATGRFECSRCCEAFFPTTVCAVAKRQIPCRQLCVLKDVPLQAAQQREAGLPFVLRSFELHASHKLRHYGGVIWCNACGCIATVKGRGHPKGLLSPCTGQPRGKNTRNSLEAMKLLQPPGANGWPASSNFALCDFG